jgi:hypothetical protein
MRPSPGLVVNHPLNAGLRHYCEPRHSPARIPALAFPDEVPNAYLTLGTHPDLIARLWDELGKVLPLDCRAVFFGSPVLLHPGSGVVFAFAGGTHAYALRLPEPERSEALQAGAPRVHHYPGNQPALDLAPIGAEWLFGRWYDAEERWCAAAYASAGRLLTSA